MQHVAMCLLTIYPDVVCLQFGHKINPVYQCFCVNFEKQRGFVRALQQLPEFQEYLRLCRTHNRVQKKDLSDLLIAPMQHQCHYQLLLEVYTYIIQLAILCSMVCRYFKMSYTNTCSFNKVGIHLTVVVAVTNVHCIIFYAESTQIHQGSC